MKKLVVALVAITAGMAVHAASFQWMAATGYVYDGSGNSGSSYRLDGTAYLFNVATYAQAALVADFYANKSSDILGAALNSHTLEGGRVYDASFDSTLTANTDVYFVVFSGDNLYVSTQVSSSYDSVTQINSVTFDSQTTTSKAFKTTSGAAYSGAGWYAVPEPTSGLLLLLGMAGLALKRKRA